MNFFIIFWNSERESVTTSESKNQVEGWFLLNVVVRESSAIFKLLTSEDETLLVWRDTFFVLNLSLNIFNCISRLNFKSDCFTSQGLDEDLHTTSKSKNQVEGWFFLNIVVRKCSSIFKLLSSKNETLLVWRDTFFVLDLSLNIFNSICRLNFEGDCFTSEGLYENLHFSFWLGV